MTCVLGRAVPDQGLHDCALVFKTVHGSCLSMLCLITLACFVHWSAQVSDMNATNGIYNSLCEL